jgi:hypothetical protein
MKERDAILTNDHWRVAIMVNLSTYHEALYTVKSDLLVEKQRKRVYTISEL